MSGTDGVPIGPIADVVQDQAEASEVTAPQGQADAPKEMAEAPSEEADGAPKEQSEIDHHHPDGAPKAPSEGDAKETQQAQPERQQDEQQNCQDEQQDGQQDGKSRITTVEQKLDMSLDDLVDRQPGSYQSPNYHAVAPPTGGGYGPRKGYRDRDGYHPYDRDGKGKGKKGKFRLSPDDKALLNTQCFFNSDGDFVVKLYDTEVFTLRKRPEQAETDATAGTSLPTAVLILTSGGFRTVETKSILNQAMLPLDLRITDSDDHTWTVDGRLFEDGMKVKLNSGARASAVKAHLVDKIQRVKALEVARTNPTVRRPRYERDRFAPPYDRDRPPPPHYGYGPPGYGPPPLGYGPPPPHSYGPPPAGYPAPHPGYGPPPGPGYAYGPLPPHYEPHGEYRGDYPPRGDYGGGRERSPRRAAPLRKNDPPPGVFQ